MIDELISSFNVFTEEAQQIFASNEASIHRVITIRETYDKLDALSVKQSDLLRQALRCIEVGAYRAAHVMAWAAIIDRLQEHIAVDSFTKLNATMPKWCVKDLTDLRERFTEHAVVEAAKAMGVIAKSQMKALQGLLSRRNECAHPSDYYPDLNQGLGYVAEVIARIKDV